MLLAEILKNDLKVTGDEWAERAGRKGSHSAGEQALAAKAAITSTVDSGGSAAT